MNQVKSAQTIPRGNDDGTPSAQNYQSAANIQSTRNRDVPAIGKNKDIAVLESQN